MRRGVIFVLVGLFLTLSALAQESGGCQNKVFGLVGASNTWDTNKDGSALGLNWRNVNIIQSLCPGSTVILKAVGGANPEAQAPLLAQVLSNDNLDYVIIDPSANGQSDFSGWTPGRYKAAAIRLAEMVKEKDSDITVIMLTNTPTKGAGGGYGTPEAVQRIKAFNADLLDNQLGKTDLIDYAVDTYSVIESSPGSDTCGYCGKADSSLGDGIHFGPTGRTLVMKAVMDTVFGGSSTSEAATFLGTVQNSGSAKQNLVAVAIQEWERWDKGATKETDPTMRQYIKDNYFGKIPVPRCMSLDPVSPDDKSGSAWSAAFISFVVRNAGISDFPFECAHTRYFRSVYDNPGTCQTHSMSERNNIEEGDIICYCTTAESDSSECNIDYNNVPLGGRGHCDIVVNNLGGSKVEVIGGNVLNNVERRTLDVSKDIGPDKRWFGFISCGAPTGIAIAPPTITPTTPVLVPVGVTVPSQQAVQPSTEKCNGNRCREIDEVWQKLTTWLAKVRKGKVWDTIRGDWVSFSEKYLKVVELKPTQTSVTPTATAKTGDAGTAAKLYRDIVPQLPNQNLAKALVANARGESGLNSAAAGDCGAYGEKNSGSSIPIPGKGRCCSFGLWQYNICGGLGVSYLQHYGSPTSDQTKLAAVQDYKKNIDYMIYYLQQTYPAEITVEKSVDEWVAWFVKNIERPANQNQEILKRQGLARDLENAGAFTSTSIAGSVLSQAGNFISAVIGGNCPPEMANINGEFCIDKWEASVVDLTTGQAASPDYYPGNLANSQYNKWVGNEPSKGTPKEMPERGAEQSSSFVPKAISAPGVMPQSFVSKVVAEAACNNAGKRLCKQEEWVTACVGEQRTKYPYGSEYVSGKCNREGAWPLGALGRSTTQLDDPRLSLVPDGRQPTGSFLECTNSYGVYDLLGNNDEIVFDAPEGKPNDALFLGTYYAREPKTADCYVQNPAHDTNYYDYSIGFRCCATLS